jgi:hypothetical protein
MGTEVATTEEPEAAYLRSSLRRIQGIVERTKEAGPWNLSTTAGLAEIHNVLADAMKRPATNGAVIDELYRKISALEGAAVDHKIDQQLLSAAKTEADTLREIQRRQGAEVTELRSQLVNARATQAGALDMTEEARKFLSKLAEQLVFLAQHDAPLKMEIAQSWSEQLIALSGKKP